MATAGLLSSNDFSEYVDAAEILEQDFLAVGAGLDDDVVKFRFGDQAALGVDLQFERGRRAHGRLADGAGRHLDVLFADGRDHIARSQAARGDFLRVEPDAHGVVARPEKLHRPGAGQPRQDVLDLQHRVVAQIDLVVAAIGRGEMHDHGEVGRLLGGRHAELADLVRQLGLGLGDPVLYLDLRLVDIGAELEGHGQRHDAVGGGLRIHVEGVLHPGNGLLERRGDGFGNRLRTRARVGRLHDDARRHDFRVFTDG
jgi:hypothetical protein